MDFSVSKKKRKDGRYQAVIELPTKTNKRERKYIYDSDKQECRRRAREFIEQYESMNILDISKATFDEYAHKWLELYCKNLSQTTLDGYTRYVRYAKKYIGDIIISKITTVDIQKMMNDYYEKKVKDEITKHSYKSCKNMLGVLNGVFKYAIINKAMPRNPCDGVKLSNTRESYQYYIYNEGEYNKLLQIVTGTKEEIPILLAGLCGLRVSEIMGLTWNDIDFDAHEINIRRAIVHVSSTKHEKSTKTKSSARKIIAPSYVVERLKIYKSVGYVYPKKDGTPEHGGYYGRRFAKLLIKHGLSHTRFHDLRHFNATMMLKNGISDKEAAERLGHSDTNMTKKYQHVLSNMKNRSADILNSIVAPMDVKKDVK